MRITLINYINMKKNAPQWNLFLEVSGPITLPQNLELNQPNEHALGLFHFLYWSPLPSLPWIILLLWVFKSLLFLFCCVFSFNFRNCDYLHAVEEYYGRIFVVVIMLLAFVQFWQITICWGGDTVVSRSPSYDMLCECECYAVKCLQVVRSAHRPWTCDWHIYCECYLYKSLDNSTNMCSVIFAYSIWLFLFTIGCYVYRISK